MCKWETWGLFVHSLFSRAVRPCTALLLSASVSAKTDARLSRPMEIFIHYLFLMLCFFPSVVRKCDRGSRSPAAQTCTCSVRHPSRRLRQRERKLRARMLNCGLPIASALYAKNEAEDRSSEMHPVISLKACTSSAVTPLVRECAPPRPESPVQSRTKHHHVKSGHCQTDRQEGRHDTRNLRLAQCS